MKRHFLSVCAALFALMILFPVMTTHADDNVYAILYDDGTLVFQHGNTPESGKTVTKTYEFDLNEIYAERLDDRGWRGGWKPWGKEKESIRVVNFADKISPTATAGWFYGCENLERVENIRNLDTTNVTTMVCMFYQCSKLTALDVSRFNTSNVTDMYRMFENCSGLTALDVSHFDTGKVECMSCMFTGCSSLTALDVSKFDTANVTSMYDMFGDCSGLTALDVSKFDTTNVTSMLGTFAGCSGLTALDVSKFDTANVKDMDSMFADCSGLTALDVSKFNTANATGMSWMFSGCSGLTALDVSKFDTANVWHMSSMFSDCSGLTALDVSKFDTANVWHMRSMFSGCSKLTALDVSKFDTAKVRDMRSMFSDCSGLTALNVSKFDTANVTDMSWMFYHCSGLTELNLSNFDTAKVEGMGGMFSGCSNLKLICTSDKFTIASVLEGDWYHGRNMFKDCTSLVGGNGTKYDSEHIDKTYARIDTPSAPGYFTDYWATVKSYVITAYVGENGTVTPEGDCRVRAGDSQKYVMTPNPGYGVQSVRIDGVDMGALSEYVFKNVVRDHSIFVSFARLPHYAITAAVKSNGQLSVTLENTSAVTVAVSYFDGNGQFVSADMKNVSADAGNVTFTLSGAYRARVSLFDSDFRPLCDPVSVS